MTHPGQLIGDRYRLLERIGAGAMGVVWRARDERLGRVVAVKQLVLTPAAGETDAGRAAERAMREGRLAARLHHPNAIAVFDVADHDGAPWLVMEHLESLSLAHVLGERGPRPPRDVAAIGRQIASALAAAHAVGIVHRDVKPGNVLLGRGGVAKLTDFGISRAADDVTVTRTGVLTGTPAYLAPEVARGAQPSAPSDVFALGATLYAAVEGVPPFGAGDNAIALLHQVARGRITPPRQAGPLTAVLMRLLRANPAERPTMAQAAAALADVADGKVASLPPAVPVHPVLPAPTPPTPPAMRTQIGIPALPVGPVEPYEPAYGDHEPSRRVPLLIAAGIALAVLTGLLITAAALRDDPPAQASSPSGTTTQAPAPTTTAAPTTTTTPPPTTTSRPATAAELQRVVTSYYGLLPKGTDKAWQRLSPSLQAEIGGYDQYRQLWREVEGVQGIPTAVDVAKSSVRVLVVYRTDDGPRAELRELTIVGDDSGYLIDTDQSLGRTAVPTTTKRRG